jgi:hypothetical protein
MAGINHLTDGPWHDGFHRRITMENKPSLTSLLREFHLRIIWDEKIKYWWLEGTDFTNRQWQSPIFYASGKNEARLAAINFIQTESAGNSCPQGSNRVGV